jgi:hypothetical protein
MPTTTDPRQLTPEELFDWYPAISKYLQETETHFCASIPIEESPFYCLWRFKKGVDADVKALKKAIAAAGRR